MTVPPAHPGSRPHSSGGSLTPVDEVMVRAARAGDRVALDALVRAHLPLLREVVQRALGGTADVDDVVQDTLVRVIRGLPELRNPAAFRPWLLSVAMRQAGSHRSRSRTAAALDGLEATGDPRLDFAGATETEVELSRQRRELTEATGWLPDRDQRLLALWWYEAAGVIGRGDLAAAAGERKAHITVRIQRMKSRLQVARVVLRAADRRHGCPEVRRLLAAGPPGAARFGRLTQHVRRCDRCTAIGRQLAPPEGLLGGLLLPVPAALVDRLPSLLAAAGPPAPGHALTLKSAAVLGSAAAAATLVAGVAIQYLPPPPAARPAAVTPSAAGPTTPTSTPASAPAIAAAGLVSADFYVGPDGDDRNPGSRGRPFATLGRAVAAVRPGQSIAVRGGRYRPTEPVRIARSGSAAAPITLGNLRGETPRFDLSALPAGTGFLEQSAANWRVEGLELFNGRSTPYLCRGCRDDVFSRLSIHDNARTGFVLRDAGTSGNVVRDSDFGRNHDDDLNGADADGLLIAYGSGGGNVVTGCRFSGNADDGLDVVGFDGAVRIDSNWAYANGRERWGARARAGSGNGFRLSGESGADHVVVNNAAWGNSGQGFDEGENRGHMKVSRNTAFGNGKAGFSFPASAAALTANLARSNRSVDAAGPPGRQQGNSWQLGPGRGDGLRTTGRDRAEGPRPVDGTLPRTEFLTGAGELGATMTGPPAPAPPGSP